MSESIIVALITGVLALVGVWVTNRKTTSDLMNQIEMRSQQSDAKLETELAVVKTEIKNLAEETRKHNNHAERITVLEEKAKSSDRRLTDLEHRKAG